MGLRPLDPAEWTEPDGRLAEQLHLKARLVAEHPEEVLAVLDDPEGRVWSAAAELHSQLVAHLLAHHPGVHRRDHSTLPAHPARVVEGRKDDPGAAEDAVGSGFAGRSADPPDGMQVGRHPVEAAGLLTQEDWCLHLPDEAGAWRLVAASVCFPTRWRLSDKLGRSVAGIHEPVTAYRQSLAAPVDRFLDRLTPQRPMWRLNWNLVDRPELFQPDAGAPPDPPIDAQDAGERLWLRVERQTFVRLPDSGAIVFGIRVFQDPLGCLADQPARCADLLGALDALPPATVQEKGLARMMDPARAWLVRRT